MIDVATVRQFYRRLNHQELGVTELVALNKNSGLVVATGFFDEERKFTSACFAYSGGCHVYAGRNPRPFSLARTRNLMNIVEKRRAKDREIHYLTAISLDIDPIRKKNEPATEKQRKAAVSFALDLQWDKGGDVDDSGNGAYLWLAFETPIEITAENFVDVKRKCRHWQDEVIRKYRPEQYGLCIDGCFDLSRIKRVIGTCNHKAGRTSRFVRRGHRSDKVRAEILSVAGVQEREVQVPAIKPPPHLPEKFIRLLKWDPSIRELWQRPDVNRDHSKHDWMLGLQCVEAGISKPGDLASILMRNPYGKFKRDERVEYIQTTVEKLSHRKDYREEK